MNITVGGRGWDLDDHGPHTAQSREKSGIYKFFRLIHNDHSSSIKIAQIRFIYLNKKVALMKMPDIKFLMVPAYFSFLKQHLMI